jgi:hypothetical protein
VIRVVLAHDVVSTGIVLSEFHDPRVEDRPSTPSRSTILSADCRITDLLTWPWSWAVTAVDTTVPAAPAPGADRCLVIYANRLGVPPVPRTSLEPDAPCTG